MSKAGFLMLVALLSTTLVSTLHPVHAAPTSTATALSVSAAPLQFAGQTFVHRWSKDNQNEFTPPEQADLSAWHEMVTINVYPTVHDGEQLAQLSNAVLANYQQAGKIVRVNSIPATATKPAEHLIVAILGAPGVLETVFARAMLVDGTGIFIVYSRRSYDNAENSQNAALETGQWLQAHGEATEKQLMSWSGYPTITTLKALPQSL